MPAAGANIIPFCMPGFSLASSQWWNVLHCIP